MDLAYGPAYTAFREEVRSFLKKNWASSEQFKGDPAKLTPEQRELAVLPRVERDRAFRHKAIAAGYLYRSVPRQYGGGEQEPDSLRADIIRDEFFRVRAPMEVSGNGTSMLVPTLLECGAE